MLLVIDNYDSFTYNLVQYFGELGADLLVKRNDEITLDEIAALKPERICISPGPCTPNEAGISNEVIRRFGPTTPLLGVCLGHQCIGHVFGGDVVRAGRLMHGKTSPILHDGEGRVRRPAQSFRSHALSLPARQARDLSRRRWKSPPRPPRAKSWACAIANSPSTACSFTPNPSSRSKAKSCCKIS